MMGLEPTTSTLARLRSTTELHPHKKPLVPDRNEQESMRGHYTDAEVWRQDFFFDFLRMWKQK